MKSNNTGKLIARLFVISLILVGAEPASSAQNANSGTTTQEEDAATQNSNTSNMNTNSGGRRRRRGRRSAAPPPNACMPSDAGTPAQEDAATTGAARKPIQVWGAGRCDPMAQEQTDLSGTYTGSIDYSEGGLSGDATLTISGNDFTLTGGGSTVEGRVVAVTTCNYTAVTMRFGKDASLAPSPTPPPPLPIVSLRARRTGSGLVLETVPGESRQFSFRSAGAPGGGRRGMRGGMKRGGPPPVGIKPPTATGHDH